MAVKLFEFETHISSSSVTFGLSSLIYNAIKKQLHKYYYKYYDAFKDDVLNRMEISYKIEVISTN